MGAPSTSDYVNDFVAQAQRSRPGMTFEEGDVALMDAEGAAAMATRLTGYAARLAKATFLDGGEGQELTDYCDDRWGIQRLAAVQATGQVTFSRISDSAGSGVIAQGTTVATVIDANGVETRFDTIAPVTFGSTDLTKTVGIVAEKGGIAGNVAAATVTRIVSAIFDASITVTNASAVIGGAEQESDDDLRERTRQFPATIRRGTLDALQYGAKNGTGAARATAVEDPDSGIVTVYVSDVDGNSSGTTKVVGDPSLTDDGTMTAKVAIELNNWRALGSLVNVIGASLFTQDVTVSLVIKAGFVVAPYIATIQAAVTAAMARLQPGEWLYRDLIVTAVKNVAPDSIRAVTVTLPGGDVEVSGNQVVRAGVVSVS